MPTPLRILLVEDEEPLASTLARMLREIWGFNVQLAHGGLEAIEILKKERPPLMLLDLYLEDVGGLKVLREAMANDPSIIVYVLTGFNDADLKQKSLAQGARDVDRSFQVSHALAENHQYQLPMDRLLR